MTNAERWWFGWWHLDRLTYVKRWRNGPLWWLVYGLNHGTRALSGGAVVSWSRWFYDNRERYRLAAFMTRLLNHADDNHGEEAPGPLWGSQDTAWAGVGAHVVWLGIVPLALSGVVWLCT